MSPEPVPPLRPSGRSAREAPGKKNGRLLRYVAWVAVFSSGLALGWLLPLGKGPGYPDPRTAQGGPGAPPFAVRAGREGIIPAPPAEPGGMPASSWAAPSAGLPAAERAGEARGAGFETLIRSYCQVGGLPPDRFASYFGEVERSVPASHRQSVLRLLMERWGEIDPRDALAFLDQREQASGICERPLLAGLASGWMRSDREAALAWALETQDAGDADFLDAAVQALAESDLPEAGRWIEEHFDTDGARRLSRLAVARAAEVDPVGLAAWAAEMPPGEFRAEAVLSAAGALSERDVYDAMDWASMLPGFPDMQDVYGVVLPRYIDRDPENAARVIETMEAGWLQADLAAHYVQSQAEVDPRAALQWAQGLEGEARQRAFSAAFEVWASREPAVALEHAIVELADRGSLLAAACGQVAAVDPALASRALDRLPPGRIRDEAAGIIGRRWAEHDAAEARRWADALGEGATRDRAIRGIVDRFLPDDPRMALELAAASTGRADRLEMLKDCLESLRSVNPATAWQAVESLGLPEEDLAALKSSR